MKHFSRIEFENTCVALFPVGIKTSIKQDLKLNQLLHPALQGIFLMSLNSGGLYQHISQGFYYIK